MAGAFYFEIAAYNGTAWNTVLAPIGGIRLRSRLLWLRELTLPSADQMDAMVPFSVFQTVPEPTTMALGGLGLAAFLVARRKKA